MKKSKFNLSYLNSTTGNAGYLIPFLLQPTLPNDTFRISLSSFIRAQPMVAPLMHEVKFYTQYWFVPNRIIWDDWEHFITGGDNLTSAPTFPVLPANTKFTVGSLGDYFGYPIGVDCAGISVLPFRAYNLIWNTRYRDEILQTDLPISFAGGNDSVTSLKLKSPSWKRDYFTTARSSVQRGSEIMVPVSTGSSPAVTKYKGISATFDTQEVTFTYQGNQLDNSQYGAWTTGRIISLTYVNETTCTIVIEVDITDESDWNVGMTTATGSITIKSKTDLPLSDTPYMSSSITLSVPNDVPVNDAGNKQTKITISGGLIDVIPTGSQNVQGSGQFSIRDLRASSALQRYAERSLEWGNRYEEFIQREFGIKPRDSRIQRPEYLGGGSGTLQISEVLQTAEGQDTGVGTMRGHGIAGISQRPIKFRSPEHGFIIGLISIRPKPVYTQGVNRELLKKSRLDFFTPELANIGMQEVLQRELFVSASNADTIFGYSDRYEEYRYNMPKVTGEFRSTLSFWNMARQFEAPPVINESFIDMSSSEKAFYRPFSSQNTHQYLMMLRNNIKAYRPVPKHARNILK